MGGGLIQTSLFDATVGLEGEAMAVHGANRDTKRPRKLRLGRTTAQRLNRVEDATRALTPRRLPILPRRAHHNARRGQFPDHGSVAVKPRADDLSLLMQRMQLTQHPGPADPQRAM